MRLIWLGLVTCGFIGAGCPAGDDGGAQSTSGADGTTGADASATEADTSATDTSGATSSSSADGPSPGTCADQSTQEACLAHVGTNDIGEPSPDCTWTPTYRVTLEGGTCGFEEDGGVCMGVAFDDTCGIEGDICENGQSVGYVIDPDGTVRIATVFYVSTCGFPDGLQPCHDVSGAPGGSGDGTSSDSGSGTTSGDDDEPPECACGCEL